jgi:hypothetical protein
MSTRRLPNAGKWLLVPLMVGVVGLSVFAKNSVGSDHQQTPLTELNPQLDITDVWVFPGSTDDRVVLAMTVGSPFTTGPVPAGLFSYREQFDPNAIYQFHVDADQDGIEDVVFQFSFDMMADGTMTADVLGPVPPRRGPFSENIAGTGGVQTGFSSTPVLRGVALDEVSSAETFSGEGPIQFFAGVRDDPFYIDLEQFFRIVPDRRPTQGPLSRIGGVTPPPPGTIASAFRPACTDGELPPDPSPFTAEFGCAVDFLNGFSALAIIIEVPESTLIQGRGGSDPQVGVWATVSK